MLAQELNERSKGRYTCTLVDQAGAVVTTLTALTLSLIDVATGAVINERDAQDALNAHDVAFANGVVTWDIQPADAVLVNATRAKEAHQAVFHATWEGGELTWPLDLTVRNLRTIN